MPRRLTTTTHWKKDHHGLTHAVLTINGDPDTYCGTPVPDSPPGPDDHGTPYCPTCLLIGMERARNTKGSRRRPAASPAPTPTTSRPTATTTTGP